MTLHWEKEQGQFCCKNGWKCIPAKHRCDASSQCPDSSDEDECSKVTKEHDYDKTTLISPEEILKVSKNQQRPVNVTIKIIDFYKIDPAESYIEIKFKMNFSWFDPRLTFRNLKAVSTFNALDKQTVWYPKVSITNLKQIGSKITLDDQNPFVEKMGKARANDRSELEMDELFSGNENPIHFKNLFKAQVFCAFKNMHRFPFEDEICHIQIVLKDMDNSLVHLRPQIIDQGPKEFMQYQIKGWIFNKTHSGQHFKLDVSVKLGRDVIVVLLVTFLPTLLMNLVNQASTYLTKYSMESFETLYAINITSMVVLAQIYLSVSTSLPATTQIKNVEIWLLSALVYPFLVIFVNILIHYRRTKKTRGATPTIAQVKPKENNPLQVVPAPEQNNEDDQAHAHIPCPEEEEAAKDPILFLLQCSVFYGLPVAYLTFAFVYFYCGLTLYAN